MELLNDAQCPTPQQLAEFAIGKLPAEMVEPLSDHVTKCPTCQAALDTLDHLSDKVILGIRESAARGIGPEDQQFYELARRMGPIGVKAAQEAEQESGSISHSVLDEEDDVMPQQLGQYRLLDRVGRGGMGTVYKARHPKLKRIVAIKVLPAQTMQDSQTVDRFLREMEAVGKLEHPNIVRAYDAGEADGRHFLVMEFIEGVTLSRRILSDPSISIEEACRVVRQAAIAVQYAHDHGLIHCDIKPSNLMLTTDGTVKMLDLGLSRFAWRQPAFEDGPTTDPQEPATGETVTRASQLLGTPGYMSPEQIQGDPESMDQRTDIYSLGVTFYELLTLQPAFSGNNRQRCLRQAAGEVPRPPRELNEVISEELEAIVLHAMAKDPESRYATAQELVDDLDRYLAGRADAESRPGSAVRHPWTGRNKWTSLAVIACCGLLIVPLLWAVIGNSRRTSVPPDATGQWILPGEALPRGQWVDVFDWIDLREDRVSGAWTMMGGNLASGELEWGFDARHSRDTRHARTMLPVVLPESYDLTTEFTRIAEPDTVVQNAVHIIFPVGKRACSLTLGDRSRQFHRLELVDGVGNDDGWVTASPGRVIDGHRYQVLISVRTKGDNASVDVSIDDKPCLNWSGVQTSLSIEDAWRLPEPMRPAVGQDVSQVAFHSAKVRSISGKARRAPHHTLPQEKIPVDRWVDLLQRVDVKNDCVDWGRTDGAWIRSEDGISTKVSPSAHRSIITFPVVIDGSFDMEASFTRHDGDNVVALLLPVRPHGCSVIISGWNGQGSWIDLINDFAPEDVFNAPPGPHVRKDGSLTNGHRYTVLVKVRQQEDKQVNIEVFLDGQPYLSWAGDRDAVKLWGYFSSGDPGRLGFAAIDCSVTFHTARLRLLSGMASIIGERPPQTATARDSDADDSQP